MRTKFVSIMILASLVLVACAQSDGPVIVATPAPTVESAPVVEPTQPPAEPQPTPIPPSATTPAEAYPYPPPPPPPEGDASGYPAPIPTQAPAAYPAPSEPVDLVAIRLELEMVADGLQAPVAIANAGDGTGRLFVLEKAGTVRVVRDGAVSATPFLDIRGRVGAGGNEQGLLGLAFHPDYAANGLFFVNYTDRGGDTMVARFSVGDDPELADPDSELVVLTQAQPAGNHNGGHLAFGPDGYLYIGLGDGGAAGDQFGNGQNGATWLAAMLRLDVDTEPFALPPDNPFLVSSAVRGEIWAIGLRNPWRYSFDRLTGDLYIADVGQNKYEEVHFQPVGSTGGENYGWPILEGSHCYPEDNGQCNMTGLELPVVEYDHSQGCSITGGYVYRGSAYPALYGVYLFGDYCSGRIWGLARDAAGVWQVAELAQQDFRLSSFGEGEDGELYLVAMDQGKLYRLVSR